MGEQAKHSSQADKKWWHTLTATIGTKDLQNLFGKLLVLIWLLLLLLTSLLLYPALLSAYIDRVDCENYYDALRLENATQPPGADTPLAQQNLFYDDCMTLLQSDSKATMQLKGDEAPEQVGWPLVDSAINIYYGLIQLTSVAVVMALVIISGVMGSTIRLSREFFGLHSKSGRQHNYTFRWYLLRPFSGAVTAVAIYILVMSGQILFSQDGGSSLSPFMVSFIALIGGFLSVQAQDRIQAAGMNFLKGKTPEPLYATKLLRSKFAELAADPDGLGEVKRVLTTYLEIHHDTLQSWIDGHTSVPPRARSALAVTLQEKEEQLFLPLEVVAGKPKDQD